MYFFSNWAFLGRPAFEIEPRLPGPLLFCARPKLERHVQLVGLGRTKGGPGKMVPISNVGPPSEAQFLKKYKRGPVCPLFYGH